MKKVQKEETICYRTQERSPVLILRDMEKRMVEIKRLTVDLERELVTLATELQAAESGVLKSLPITLD